LPTGSSTKGYEKAKARGAERIGRLSRDPFCDRRRQTETVTHPVYELLGAGDFREGPWREQSRRLLEEPELRYWVITDEWVQDCLAALHEAQSSPLILNQVQKEERLAAVVRDAVKTLCAGDRGRAFKRRMEDMALYFAKTERSEKARLALAVAQQVAERRSRATGYFVLDRPDAEELCLFHVAAQSSARSAGERTTVIADHQAVSYFLARLRSVSHHSHAGIHMGKC
jgi:hypothetical protein